MTDPTDSGVSGPAPGPRLSRRLFAMCAVPCAALAAAAALAAPPAVPGVPDEDEVLALIAEIATAEARVVAALDASDSVLLGRRATVEEELAYDRAADAHHSLRVALCAAPVAPGSAAGRAKAAWLRTYLLAADLTDGMVDGLIAAMAVGAGGARGSGEERGRSRQRY